MPLLFVVIGILVLLVLMIVIKLDAFFALLITSFLVGLLNQMPLANIIDSVLDGIGNTMGSIILILAFGAMLGKLIEESGAAHRICGKLTAIFGIGNIQYVILVTGFIVGIPMMYNASFLVLIPLIYTLSSTTKIPMMYIGIPLSAALSVAHGYLPPHPAPTYVSIVYGADINRSLLVGMVPVIPACLLGGIFLSRFFKKLKVQPPAKLYEKKEFSEEELPGISRALFTILLPVLLMFAGAGIDIWLGQDSNYSQYFQQKYGENNLVFIMASIISVIKFISNPNTALMLAVLVGLYTLGVKQGREMPGLMKSMGKSASSIAMIVLIIAAGGAFKQVLNDSGVANYIKIIASDLSFNPLVLAWSTAAVIRLAVGSATVATMTAAGIMLPIVSSASVSPELMVLATGAGSLMFSHFNDIGFWMFKEYYNVSIKQTFLVWTVMESIVAIVGLISALLMDIIL